MRTNFIISGLTLLFFATSAQAQVLVDASKITCDQFVHGKVGSPRTMAAWFSGFYNGGQNNVMINTQNFQANLNKVERFCYQEKNFDVLVMKAIEQVIGGGK
jgi:acid stress chaperone HdeB